MKKTLILSLSIALSVVCVNIVNAQKYGYCTYLSLNGTYYISQVHNLVELNSSVSQNDQYGKKSLIIYYSDVMSDWYSRYLKSQNVRVEIHSPTASVKNANAKYDSCTYGNEDGCFMTEEEATNSRQEEINDFQRRRVYIILTVEN